MYEKTIDFAEEEKNIKEWKEKEERALRAAKEWRQKEESAFERIRNWRIHEEKLYNNASYWRKKKERIEIIYCSVVTILISIIIMQVIK